MPSIKELKESIIKHVGVASFEAMAFSEKSEMLAFLEKFTTKVTKRKKGVFLCERGKYILGDPCYIALDVCDLETFNETYYDPDEKQQEDGIARKKEIWTPRFHAGWEVSAALNTRFTSPTWCSDSTDTYSFLINSGVICLMPLPYNPKFNEENAHIIEFDEDFECKSERGILHFGHIKINTAIPEGKSKKGPKSSWSATSKSMKKDVYMKDGFVVDDDEEESDPDEDECDDESEYQESSDDEENHYKRHEKRKKQKR